MWCRLLFLLCVLCVTRGTGENEKGAREHALLNTNVRVVNLASSSNFYPDFLLDALADVIEQTKQWQDFCPGGHDGWTEEQIDTVAQAIGARAGTDKADSCARILQALDARASHERADDIRTRFR
jgi:pyruvoyl-dependent arginine decarboxylase (PvlArgDC)